MEKRNELELSVEEVNVYSEKCGQVATQCKNDCIGGTGCFIRCTN